LRTSSSVSAWIAAKRAPAFGMSVSVRVLTCVSGAVSHISRTSGRRSSVTCARRSSTSSYDSSKGSGGRWSGTLGYSSVGGRGQYGTASSHIGLAALAEQRAGAQDLRRCRRSTRTVKASFRRRLCLKTSRANRRFRLRLTASRTNATTAATCRVVRTGLRDLCSSGARSAGTALSMAAHPAMDRIVVKSRELEAGGLD